MSDEEIQDIKTEVINEIDQCKNELCFEKIHRADNFQEEHGDVCQVSQQSVFQSAALNYIQKIFEKKHIDEFLDTLTDEQSKIIYTFLSGFRTHATVTQAKMNIVGVYSPEYLESRDMTPEVLNNLGLKVVKVEDKDFGFSFVLIWE